MIIEYEVKDLLHVLIKRWYIVLIFIVAFAMIGLPLSSFSYNSVLENYEKMTSMDFLVEEQIKLLNAKQEEKITSEEISEDLKLIGANLFFRFEGPLENELISDPSLQSKRLEDDTFTLKTNIIQFSKSDLFLIDVFNEIAKEVTSIKYSNFKANFSIEHIVGTDIIQIHIVSIPQAGLDAFLEYYPLAITNFLADTIGLEFTMELDKVMLDNKPTEPILLVDEREHVKSLAKTKLDFNVQILRKPTVNGERVKYMGTAGLFGGLIGCFFVLLLDFIRRSKSLTVRNKPEV